MLRRPNTGVDAVERMIHGCGYIALTAATAVVDALPVRLRFGHARTLIQRTLGLRGITQVPSERQPCDVHAVAAEPPRSDGTVCALVTETLDVGGVEAVVGILARELPEHGLACTVVTLHDGRQAEALRRAGATVVVVGDASGLGTALEDLRPDVVQVHTATPPMIEALIAHGAPLVPVVHNVELYRGATAWAATAELSHAAPLTIAVSEAVRLDHLDHVGARGRGPVTVVPNGAPRSVVESAPPREVARSRVSDALGVDLAGDLVVVSLARYDIQKNPAGLVDAFLLAAALEPRLRLIVAGEPSDWLEYRRADALRRSHRLGGRVHLLGDSDAATLLSSADVFALDSYFEGWPVSATEARTLGLPVVMSDVGGARELVGTGSGAGSVAPNPAGASLTPRSVARARRRLHQTTRVAFADALVAVAHGHPRQAADGDLDTRAAMITEHSAILRRAALTAASR